LGRLVLDRLAIIIVSMKEKSYFKKCLKNALKIADSCIIISNKIKIGRK